jgi:hypothetical protein
MFGVELRYFLPWKIQLIVGGLVVGALEIIWVSSNIDLEGLKVKWGWA